METKGGIVGVDGEVCDVKRSFFDHDWVGFWILRIECDSGLYIWQYPALVAGP